MRFSDNRKKLSRRLGVLSALAAVCGCTVLLAAFSGSANAAPGAQAPMAAESRALEAAVRVTEARSCRERTVPYETVTLPDDTMYSDEQEVVQEGADGLCRDIVVTVYTDGERTEEYVDGTQMLVEPVDKIIRQGTLPGSRTDSRGTYIWPTTGIISSGYGRRSISGGSSNHKGLDIANDVGTEVFAADGGLVIYADFWAGSGYGNIIKLQHDNGDVTYYAHLSQILVAEGDRVAQGQLIALMGATGNVTGPHLHFELRPGGGSPINPVSHLTGELKRI